MRKLQKTVIGFIGKSNRFWKRCNAGFLCDVCGKLIVGFMSGMKNRDSGRILCLECYEKGKV